MRGLSIRHPWAWAIVHAGKRIENRDWYCDYRGPVLIHASKLRLPKRDKIPAEFVREWRAMQRILDVLGVDKQTLPAVSFRSLASTSGGIVGRARIVDCILPEGGIVGSRPREQDSQNRESPERHRLADDPWYMGGYGFVLEDVEPLPFVAYPGALGLWKVKDKVMETIERLAGANQCH
jgi:hypothetical protein